MKNYDDNILFNDDRFCNTIVQLKLIVTAGKVETNTKKAVHTLLINVLCTAYQYEKYYLIIQL